MCSNNPKLNVQVPSLHTSVSEESDDLASLVLEVVAAAIRHRDSVLIMILRECSVKLRDGGIW